MQNGRHILIESKLSLDSVILNVGYDSAATFSKAFKRIVDRDPRGYRRTAN